MVFYFLAHANDRKIKNKKRALRALTEFLADKARPKPHKTKRQSLLTDHSPLNN